MAPYADQLSSYGAVKTKVISDSGAPGGTAMEVNVRRRAANPWDGGLSGPIGGAIRRGDTIVMSFWAKTMSGEGVISNAGLQLNRAPYTAITLKPLNVGREWQQFFVSVTATRDYAPSESGYVIHTAGAKQTLRFGPVFVLNLGQNIDRSKLPEH